MKSLKILIIILLTLLSTTSVVFAGDFDWIRDFNIRAEADLSGFRARMEARFRVGDLEIKAVLGDVEKPSDAYILFRFGEMSNQPIDHIVKKYKTQKGKGWGVLAKSLGIEPGSKDFQALKQGQDLYGDINKGKGKSKKKGKGRK
jgi:hypothetical protein